MSYHLGWGTGRPTPADRNALPQPYSDLGSDYCSFLLNIFTATICGTSVNVNYIYCLITLATLVVHPYWDLSDLWINTEISYDKHLIIIQIRPGFHIYTLERSFCLPLYIITMIQYYSRCVLWQILWLRILIQHSWLYTGFYIWSHQELCANWIITDALGRGRPREPANISHEIPMTTDHATS